MFHKILMPYDGQELSLEILPHVVLFARTLDIPTLVLSVKDPDALDLPVDLRMMAGPWERELTERLRQVTEKLAARDINVSSMIEYGRAHRRILEIAEQEDCDLIALSTHGRGFLNWVALGSVTYHTLHRSTVPVLAVSPHAEPAGYEIAAQLSRIVVPLDGSALAETALPYAEYLASRFSIPVQIVRAVHSRAELPGVLARSISDEAERKAFEEIEAYLENVTGPMKPRGLDASWKVLKGSAGYEIVREAKSVANTMIAMTTHGKSGLLPGVLGSTSISVLRNASVPVLVIPPPTASATA
jgi:nucleotide-binding universal stress UspA family protein